MIRRMSVKLLFISAASTVLVAAQVGLGEDALPASTLPGAIANTNGRTSSVDETTARGLMEEKLPFRCGGNALYLLIRLQGGLLDYSAITDRLEQTANGNSLLELRSCAEQLGYDAVVERIEGNRIGNVPLPIIAHLSEAMLNNRDVGHFVVILDVSADTVTYLDGTTGKKNTEPRTWFEGIISGYTLRLTSPDRWASRIHVATFVVIVGLSVCLVRYYF